VRETPLRARNAAVRIEQSHVDLAVAIARVVPRNGEAIAKGRQGRFERAFDAVGDLRRLVTARCDEESAGDDESGSEF
jgi:hypothetical protein